MLLGVPSISRCRTALIGLNFGIEYTALVVYKEVLRYLKRLLTMLTLKFRELCSVVKEVTVSRIKATKSLLKRLGIDGVQPHKIRVSLQFCQHLRRIMVGQALLFFPHVRGIEIHAFTEEAVIDETAGAEVLSKKLFLLFRRIQSETVCFIDYHVLHDTT